MTSKTMENKVRRAGMRKGLLLRKSRKRNRSAEDYGLYVLVEDKAGNRRRGAQAPISEFAKGWGRSLEQISAEIDHRPDLR